MQYRRLGKSGLVVSVVGLGGNNFGRRIDLDATRAVINTAIDEGITLFDTADIYGESEDFLGKLLRGNRDNLGISNVAGWQVADAEWTARSRGLTRFISVQNNYNLLERDIEAEVTPACLKYGLGILPYFPLASGLLTGKYRRGEPPPQGTRLAGRPEALTDRVFDVIDKLEKYAAERGRSLLDVAIGGLAAQPAVA